MRPRLFPTLLLAALLPALGLGTATAHADSASLSFTDASGKSDPVAGVGRTATLSGSTASSKRLYVRHRPAGGAPCAPSASSDSGEVYLDGDWNAKFYGDYANGAFKLQSTGVWNRPRTEMFCIWIADNDSQSVTPISQTFTFRAPSATVSGTVEPVAPMVGAEVTLTVTGTSEAPKEVFGKVRDAGGAPCAATYDSDTGGRVFSGNDVNGSFTFTATFVNSSAGDKLLCLWVADSSSDASPVAGPQPVLFTVLAPCVVPTITPGRSLAEVQGLLAAASCTAGTQRLAASALHPRGTVVRLGTKAGTSLQNGSPIVVVLSDGPPCIVPRVTRGMTVTAAKRALQRSGCTPGAVRSSKTRRRRATVIRFGAPQGKRLSPRTAVAIIRSRGR